MSPEAPERVILDCVGESCPMPIIKLSKLVEKLDPGTEIEVLNDDPGSKVDIPVWCRMRAHEFLAQEDREHGWSFLLRV